MVGYQINENNRRAAAGPSKIPRRVQQVPSPVHVHNGNNSQVHRSPVHRSPVHRSPVHANNTIHSNSPVRQNQNQRIRVQSRLKLAKPQSGHQRPPQDPGGIIESFDLPPCVQYEKLVISKPPPHHNAPLSAHSAADAADAAAGAAHSKPTAAAAAAAAAAATAAAAESAAGHELVPREPTDIQHKQHRPVTGNQLRLNGRQSRRHHRLQQQVVRQHQQDNMVAANSANDRRVTGALTRDQNNLVAGQITLCKPPRGHRGQQRSQSERRGSVPGDRVESKAERQQGLNLAPATTNDDGDDEDDEDTGAAMSADPLVNKPTRLDEHMTQKHLPTSNIPEMSPSKAITASPIQCPSRAGPNTDNHPAIGSFKFGSYSPEDALNNDFFYDDEFSVPFDANLGENETQVMDVQMLDSMDINQILTLSRVYDNDHEPAINQLVMSKSDQSSIGNMTGSQNQTMTTSGDLMHQADIESSGDHSMSDPCSSSADLSELQNEPLFSPLPQSAHNPHQHHDEHLSGSFTMGGQFAFDWTSSKGQYMLSFDNRGGHRGHSDDDSSRSELTSSMTSWAQKSRDSSSNFMLWGSGDSLGCVALSSGDSTPANGSPRHAPRHRIAKTAQTEQPLTTTWSKLRQENKVTDDDGQKDRLTTWSKVREEKSDEEGNGKMKTSIQHEDDPTDAVNQETEDNNSMKRSSHSLFELYQKLKQQQEAGACMSSSDAMMMLTGTWSVSPVTSVTSGQMSERSPSSTGMTTWTIMKDSKNNSLRTSVADSIDSTTPDKSANLQNSKTSPDGSVHSKVSLSCNTSYKDMTDAQCGSLVLTKSLIFGTDNKDFCGQFPPNAQDTSVQTSWEYGIPLISMINRSLQTSLGSSTESSKGLQLSPQTSFHKPDAPKLNSFRELAPKNQGTNPRTPSPVDPTAEPLKRMEPSLTSSLIFSNTALPDLSFLNTKGMTQSISTFLDQATRSQPLFNPRMAHADALTSYVDMAIGMEALAREKKTRAIRESTSEFSSSSASTGSSGFFSGCFESPSPTPHTSNLANPAPTQIPETRPKPKPRLSKVKDPNIQRVKEVTSFAELATKQNTANNKKSEKSSKRSAFRITDMQIPDYKPKPQIRDNQTTPGPKQKPVEILPPVPASITPSTPAETLEPTPAIPPPKPPRHQVCTDCIAPRDEMISSVPVYSEPIYKMVAHPMKQVEYLQVSPTHRPSDTEQCSCEGKKPLKSCLVKRRHSRKNYFKHRSYPDTRNLALMKYGQKNDLSKALSNRDDQELLQVLFQTQAALPLPEPLEPKSTLSDKPDVIPTRCTCQDTEVVKPTEEPEEGDDSYQKKTVKFAEKVSFHSPYNSPSTSPRKPHVPLPGSKTRPKSQIPAYQSKPVPVASQSTGHIDLNESSDTDDGPPSHFTVSPSSSPPNTTTDQLKNYSNNSEDLMHKKELVDGVIKAAEKVLTHFAKTRDPAKKLKLGSSAITPEIGHLILNELCPAIHAVLLDGLKPHIRSLFGRIRNSVWKVVEDSAELGPSTRIIHDLVHDLKNLGFLSTNWLRVNAFIFGLLNHKALDFWLTYIHNQESLLARHYTSESFFYLSATSGRRLFLDMTTALQPLGQLPFRLEYQLEYQTLQALEQRRLSDCLIEQQHNMMESVDNQNDKTNTTQPPQMDITAGLFGVGTKRLLGKIHTRGSLITSLSSVFTSSNTNNHKPCSKPDIPSPTTKPGISPSDSNQTLDDNEATPVVSPAGSDSVPVMWTNIGTDTNASPEENPQSILSLLTDQVKYLASVESRTSKPPTTLPTEQQSPQEQESPGTKPHTDDDLPTNNITNSSTDSGIDGISPDEPPSEFNVVCELPYNDLTDNRNKRWSDTAARWIGMDSGDKVEVGLTEVKKRWSSVLKMFDKLLVDNPAAKMESPPWQEDALSSPHYSPNNMSSPDNALTPTSSVPRVVDWDQCETVTDIEQVLRDAPAGVQLLGRMENTMTSTGSEAESMKERQEEYDSQSNMTPLQEDFRYVEALCGLVSMTPDQLSFRQGQRMKVVRQVDDDLLLCQSGEREGLVHAACVKELNVTVAEYII